MTYDQLKVFHDLVCNANFSSEEAQNFIESYPNLQVSDKNYKEVVSFNIEEQQEKELARHERLEDLEGRGFYFGVDCPYHEEAMIKQEAFNDKLEMFRNEY